MVSANSENSTVPGNSSPAASPFTLAHLSDPHIARMDDVTARDLVSKRLLGYLRWKLLRSAEHGSGVLSALEADLAQTKPDHIVVTGDLTHLGLSAEYREVGRWLRKLGPPSRVTIIPGNHDAYVKLDWHQTMAHWTDYMISDASGKDDHQPTNAENLFPCLRIRKGVAIIGVSTARPSAPHLAVGSIGAAQLKKLEAVLAQMAPTNLYRVLLIHHPPAPGIVDWRKRLTDASDLRPLLERYGVDLILHGPAHRALRNSLPTPVGNIPVMGAPSISALGRTPERRARYYIYQIAPGNNGWKVSQQVRIYSAEDNRFVRESGPINVE